MDRPVSRRDFLRAGAGSAAAAAALVATGTGTASAAPTSVATYALSPTATGRWCRRGHNNGDCSSCGACTKHAANKVFRSPTAANAGRAHARCRCEVVAGPALSTTAFDALFGGSTPSVDRRDAEVAALLDNGDADAVSVPIFSSATPVLLGGGVAAGLAVWWWRGRRDQAERATVEAEAH